MEADTVGLWTSAADLWNADPGKADSGTFFVTAVQNMH